MSKPTIPTRESMSRFIKDPQTLRQFEALFKATANSNVDPEIADLYARTDANAEAASNAQDAADSAQATADAVTLATQILAAAFAIVESAPVIQHNNSVVADYIDFPINHHVTQERRFQWNDDDGTYDGGLKNGVVLQVGQEMHYYIKNDSGVTIPDGASVMATGTIGNSGKLKGAKAVADGSVAAKYMLGIATQEILDGDFGYVTAFGLVRGLNTSTYSDGDLLYFNPATPGGLTKTEPAAPYFKPPIAIVIHAHNNGSIFVRMKNGEYLHDLIDVYAPSLADQNIIRWIAANSRWEASNYIKSLRFGAGSDYSTFEDDGTLVANGAATVWQDIDFPIIIRTTGVNIPTLATLQGNITAPQWQVNDYNVCEGQELVHQWKEGSTIYWHVHFVTNGLDGTARYVKWEVEWFWADINGVLSATTTSTAEITIPANTTSKTMILGSIASATLTGGHIGGHVFARLRRIASVGTAPTGDPWCTMLQMHVECDTIGSRNIGTK